MQRQFHLPTRSRFLALLLLLATLSGISVSWFLRSAHGQLAVRKQGYVPFSDAPIHYLSDQIDDPVANLQRRLDAGKSTLTWDEQRGYLKSVLQQLNIPASSQTLVFSKTSFQYKKISPQTPRALYFNDDVYVGFVHDGKALEVVSFDPNQGAIFYLLDARRVEKPAFQRAELDCTQCHIAPATRNVPGVLLRSILPTATGTQVLKSTSYVTGQDSPISERWGGWYVTGSSGHQSHMGNSIVDNSPPAEAPTTAILTDISGRFERSAYLSADSDIVAHLVLAHQTQMHNLITLTNYRTRIALFDEAKRIGENPSTALSDETRAQIQAPAEELLRYLLFTNEAPLKAPIHGSSNFTRQFESLGPRDSRGRSLRDFDLHTRTFKYPCSYLIYSASFDSLPDAAREYIYRRLFEVLTGRDRSTPFSRLTRRQRKDIFEILLATKPGLPEEWKLNRNTLQHAEQSASSRLRMQIASTAN